MSEEELQQAIREIRDTIATVSSGASEDSVEVIPAQYREVGLCDSNLFELKIGKRVLKQEITDNGIPVYSANVTKPFGYLDEPVADDFARPALLWGIDGNFDWGFIPAETPFIHTDHCGVLYVVNDSLVPRYVYHELRVTKDSYGFDRTYRANLANMQSTVKVRIPVKRDGSFDVEAQRRMAERYDNLQSIKTMLVDQLEAISGMQVVI